MDQIITNYLTYNPFYHKNMLAQFGNPSTVLHAMAPNRIIDRALKIDLPANRSAFLWGPRKTGKTTLLRQQFSKACWIDLLDYDLFLRLSQKPTQLRQILEAQPAKTVVIDEVQKIPQLMDEVHRLIEARGYRFILSGSSARKFK